MNQSVAVIQQTSNEAIIKADSIYFSERYTQALSLANHAGELSLIVGPTGRGKTALMQTLAGLRAPSSGSAILLDQNVYQLPAKTWQKYRQHIGYVMPSRSLVSHLTVLQNVSLPLIYHRLCEPSKADQFAAQLLSDLGLSEKLDHLPGQLDEPQRRLTTLARPLVMNPVALFIDQAFAHFDAATRNSFIDLYLRLIAERNLSMILASKDLRTCARLAAARDTNTQTLFMGEDQLFLFSDFKELMQSDHPQVLSFKMNHDIQ